ncbi:MAG: lipoyl synthase [Victivallaceae bacterium]|nr:lipoyl synthase [Victivallaceae bacterium]
MKNNLKQSRPKLPPWIRVKVGCGTGRDEVAGILDRLQLNTVCSSARCPNLGECWHRKTATFMIMGNECTRNCKFCAVDNNCSPAKLEADEPQRIAEAAKAMELKYVVVTSVTRDDLPDGGAAHFAAVITALRNALPNIGIEVLTPDFNVDLNALKTVLDAKPTVFNHNLETVQRLSKQIRSKANYEHSLQVLRNAAEIGGTEIPVKSGLMVGMGECDEEVVTAIRDLHRAGVSILTIGQYLPPTGEHWVLDRYVTPETFAHWKELALQEGFKFVASAPLVRSSYNAAEFQVTTK